MSPNGIMLDKIENGYVLLFRNKARYYKTKEEVLPAIEALLIMVNKDEKEGER